MGFASRIDGGSNAGHWYSSIYWGGEPMLMGERVAREVRLALEEDRLGGEVVT